MSARWACAALLLLACAAPARPVPARAPAVAAACSGGFEGVWRTEYGPLRLHVSGGRATGSYDNADGVVEGTVTGKVLEGTWRDYSGHGTMRFELTSSRSMSGSWARLAGPGGKSGAWDGECVADLGAQPDAGAR